MTKIIVSLMLFIFLQFAQAQGTKPSEKGVSTVNGQVVPVGEQNKYYYDYKRWNVWTNPFGYFFGSFSAGVSRAVTSNVKLNFEPQGIYTFLADNPVKGFGASLSGSLFFKKVYDGFYLEPGYRFLWLKQNSSNVSGVVNALQLVGGWGWIWDSGFTFNIGLGLGYYFGKEFTNNDAFDGIGPAGNLQFGYAF